MEIRLYRPPEVGDIKIVPLLVTQCATARYIENYFTFGEFEFSVANDAYGSDRFDKYLLVLINRSYWGLILSIEKQMDASGGNMLTISGIDLKGLINARVTTPPGFTYQEVGGIAGFDTATGSTETCMKHFIASNFFDNNSPTRSVAGLTIAPDLGRGFSADKYMTRFEPLSEVLYALGRGAGIGYAIVPDINAGTLVFDCIEGLDRSALQSVNPRIVFEIERRNVAAMTYQNSDKNMRNLFYASLSGSTFIDDTYTATVTRGVAPLPTGIHRWEQHLDISASHPTAGAELDELVRLALARAESYVSVETFQAQILNTPLSYGVDYFIGDIVTVQNREWGITMNTRLTSMTIEASNSGIAHNATFGDAAVNIFERLKREIRGG